MRGVNPVSLDIKGMSISLDPQSAAAIARELAVLLDRRTEPSALLTADQVAERFNVDRGWVYAHAGELGVLRLGCGRRPRLRFDPAVVAQALLADPPAWPPARPTRPITRTRPQGPIPLLPVNRDRTVGGENRIRRP